MYLRTLMLVPKKVSSSKSNLNPRSRTNRFPSRYITGRSASGIVIGVGDEGTKGSPGLDAGEVCELLQKPIIIHKVIKTTTHLFAYTYHNTFSNKLICTLIHMHTHKSYTKHITQKRKKKST